MKCTVLMSDDRGREDLTFEHGLSLYIETGKHRVFLDTGATSATLANAEKLGIDAADADAIFLSHGHYDHTGGILAIAEKNPAIRVYARRGADGAFFHGERYIGADRRVFGLKNFTFLDGDAAIDGELFALATGKSGSADRISAGGLTVRRGGVDLPDDFVHEQSLVVSERGRRYLFCGCSHGGILSILDRFSAVFGGEPDAVFGGFHFAKKTPFTDADEAQILAVAARLAAMPTRFYTGHCTGEAAFALMKPVMKERLTLFRPGDLFRFGEERIV